MKGTILTAALASLGALASAQPASAYVVSISGARQNVNPLAPLGVGRCGPGRSTVTIGPGNGSSTGTSNLGAFTSIQSHCITPPLPASYDSGIFTYDFGSGDTLVGTYSGAVALGMTPGVFHATENLVVSGGTGRFLNATGLIDTSGTLQFLNGNGVYSGTIAGRLEIPSVPEPAAWAMMIAGFGLAGAAARRRKLAFA
ncbi:hypothetical protein SCH01S_48_00450 [Sphingomonas changbaiensis NBRC 104936]|uniref:Ice-binding protein C-terminal domain-containing protein n=1 Tax=Sphingomonas changbaiensis NBRC 104936 TaxID=1219043 RepID=A0A0E9MRK7_9SPHN|nr:PEPxxWA-CTERM sorting domain-containing protein [Sphingomonas changbaiensis]GAO40387.1 hypothetical protein SCH01S_48_00450 [Sphingomonas changbaiensis NBRC 104936]